MNIVSNGKYKQIIYTIFDGLFAIEFLFTPIYLADSYVKLIFCFS